MDNFKLFTRDIENQTGKKIRQFYYEGYRGGINIFSVYFVEGGRQEWCCTRIAPFKEDVCDCYRIYNLKPILSLRK